MSFPTVFCLGTLALLSTLLFTNVSATSRPIFNVKAESVDLQKICEGTTDPDLCLQTLNSDDRTKSAPDIQTIMSISLDIATQRAGETHATLFNLSLKVTDPELQFRYSQCTSLYAKSLANFVRARADIIARDITDMVSKVSDIVLCEENCEDMFEAPPEEPTELKGVVKVDALVSLMVLQFARMQ